MRGERAKACGCVCCGEGYEEREQRDGEGKQERWVHDE